ncbi:MAG: hypothetical protein IJF78_13490 [Clostridia bacterium]|nr:hypothetical protein [Clostridia bacterium]
MNGAENYLEHIRNNALRRTAVRFLLYLLTAVLCCWLSRLLFLRWDTETSWQITSPAGSPMVSAVLTQSGTLLLLLIRLAGTFTALSRPISVLTVVLRGCSVGCCSALLSRGLVYGFPPEQLWISSLSLLLLPALCGVSDLYADCVLVLTGLGEHRARASLIREYTAIFACLSGILLLTGILSALFLS